jgi:hypothetical protein
MKGFVLSKLTRLSRSLLLTDYLFFVAVLCCNNRKAQLTACLGMYVPFVVNQIILLPAIIHFWRFLFA